MEESRWVSLVHPEVRGPDVTVNDAVRTEAETRLRGADVVAGLLALVGQGTSFVRCSELGQYQPVKIRHWRTLWQPC